jgi:SOS response regulatory protein OraA/RecX
VNEKTQPTRTERRRREPADIEREALRLLARRPLTESELSDGLARLGFRIGRIAGLVERFRSHRYLDDARVAREFIVTRAERLGHGPERLLRDLERRGIPARVARAAWRRALEQGDLDPDGLLQRRLQRELERAGAPLDRRGYRRAYHALLRAGFGAESIVAALAPHCDEALDDDSRAAGTEHDLA